MTKRTDAGEALTNLILETFRLNGAMLESGNRLTKPLGLTSARWQVMGSLSDAGQPITASQIARRMGLARQSVQRLVNELKGLGMVELHHNIDHKRAHLVALSEEGRNVMKQVDGAQARWVNALADGLSERQLTQATRLLERIRERTENG